MTCDGSPGNPGTYVQPTDDGPEHVACTGCSVCKPWNYEPFRSSPAAQVPEYMQGRPDVEEAARGLAWAKQNPDAFKNEQGWVPCRSTRYGPGCGHNTLEHTGPDSVNSECDCCTWRNGPDDVVRDPKTMSVKERETLEHQAALYASHALKIVGGFDDMSGMMSSVLETFSGPSRTVPNRAERRRARGKGRGIAGGNLPNRRKYRG